MRGEIRWASTKLGDRIGVLPPDFLGAIETGLMHALDLRPLS